MSCDVLCQHSATGSRQNAKNLERRRHLHRIINVSNDYLKLPHFLFVSFSVALEKRAPFWACSLHTNTATSFQYILHRKVQLCIHLWLKCSSSFYILKSIFDRYGKFRCPGETITMCALLQRLVRCHLLWLAIVATWWELAEPCGVLTHIEIAHRASYYFTDKPNSGNYKALIDAHQDAFQAGNPYPDAMYASICYAGEYHQVAEDTHWTPFMVATIDYIRDTYPQPWNTTAQKLVVFLLGFVSHQVADVLWHNLGVHNGFLQSMADANFHGDFSSAHPVGDLGGDVVGSFEWNKSYVNDVSWYVPSTDLEEIYRRYYATQPRPRNVSSTVIETCTRLLYLARFGEKVALEKLFPDYASKSPFLVEELNQFYIGGLDDNAAWTTLLWQDAITMLANGTNTCQHSKNPVETQCPGGSRRITSNSRNLRSVPPTFGNSLDESFVEVERVDGGIVLRPSSSGQKLLHQIAKPEFRPEEVSKELKGPSPAAAYMSFAPYARLGWSYASGDLNGDSFPDLIIGAPGYTQPPNALVGCVYVVFGTSAGFPGTGHLDIDTVANGKLVGQEQFARFGTSVTLLDYNHDGHLDIAIGAPSTHTSSLGYLGEVLVYLNPGNGSFSNEPSVRMSGSVPHQNFGWTLASGDFDADGMDDLIVASPFYSAGKLNQEGSLDMFNTSATIVQNPPAVASLNGLVSSGWFGHTLEVANTQHQTLLIAGAPDASICKDTPDCSQFSGSDLQSVGNLSVFTMADGKTFSPVLSLGGNGAFEKFGSSAAVGQMFPGVDVLAVSAPTANVKGHVAGIPYTLNQAGRVFLFNMSDPASTTPFAVLEGDRQYGRFGWKVAFADLDGDGADDLLVTAALRIDDFTELLYAGEQGIAYVYNGGNSFRKLKWPAVTSNCGLTIETPCPDKVASQVLSVPEKNSRFGSSLHAVRRPKGNSSFVVGAIHSNLGARMSGTVYIY